MMKNVQQKINDIKSEQEMRPDILMRLGLQNGIWPHVKVAAAGQEPLDCGPPTCDK